MRDVVVERALALGQRRTLGQYLDLCEENYLLLDLLVGGVERCAGEHRLRAAGALDLHLSVVEQTRYTTTFHMTYRFHDPALGRDAPDLQVRAYHDARVCEVMTEPVRDPAAPPTASMLEARWRANRFFGKWLEYLLSQGHRLPAGLGASRPRG